MEDKNVNRRKLIDKLNEINNTSAKGKGWKAKDLKKPKPPSRGNALSGKNVGRSKSVKFTRTPDKSIEIHLDQMDLEDEDMNIYEDKFDLYGSQNSLNDDIDFEKFTGSNKSKSKSERNRVTFISPRPVSAEIPLDNMYDISGNGAEELSRMIMTDNSYNNPSNENRGSFFDRIDFLESFLQQVQDECQPKSILKPERAVSASEGNKRTSIQQLEAGDVETRPFTAPTNQGNSKPRKPENREKDETAENNRIPEKIRMEPYVYSYYSGKQMCTYDKDKKPGEKTKNVPNRREKLDDKQMILAHNYTEENVNSLAIPSTITHFMPWLTPNVSEDVIGIDPQDCLVFLPSLQFASEASLPTIPKPQKPDDELNFIEKLYPPKKEKRKVYEHPWRKQNIEEWKCHHGSYEVFTPRIQVISNNGDLIHESYNGHRGVDIIRKEIQELENLMKGEGSFEGCVVVQYQAELNELQYNLQEMAPRMEEIERRLKKEEEIRRKKEEKSDYFGMKKFYREHDQVMTQIRHQHRLCRLELAALEDDLHLQDQYKHFTSNFAIR